MSRPKPMGQMDIAEHAELVKLRANNKALEESLAQTIGELERLRGIDEANDDLRAKNRELENDIEKLNETIDEMEKEHAIALDEAGSEIDPEEILHEGLREFGADLGSEDVPYGATTTAHQMRLRHILLRAGVEAWS